MMYTDCGEKTSLFLMLWFIHHSWLDLILLPQSSCPVYFPQCNLLLIAFLLIHSLNSSYFRPLHTSLIGLTASYDWLTASHPFLEFFLFPSFFLFNDAEHYLYLDSGYNWPKLLFNSNTVDLSNLLHTAFLSLHTILIVCRLMAYRLQMSGWNLWTWTFSDQACFFAYHANIYLNC